MGIREIMQHQAARFVPIAEFTDDVMRGTDELTQADRELIAAYTSGLNQCSFCHNAHEAVAIDLGVEPGLLGSLLDDSTLAELDPRLRPAFQFVRKLTLESSKLSQADAQAVLDAGFSEHILEDIVAICALFSFYNRIIDGHGVHGSAVYFKELPSVVRKHGYAGRLKQELQHQQR